MNFTVYRSSAGSGKTFTLVREYLRIALSDTADPPQRYRKILAITFTNKAAAEMKDRIVRALKELSKPEIGKLSAMSDALKKELNLDDLTLATRAQNLLRAILHNYTDFAIGTIDSFTHRIVRAFAHDLRLPVNFEVEMDAEKLVREAVDILIGKIGEDKELTELLVQFSAHKADEEKTWQIENEIRDIGKELLKEEGAQNAKLLGELTINDFVEIKVQLKKSKKAFEDKLILLAKSGVHLMNINNLSVDAFSYTNKGIAGRFIGYASGHLKNFGESNSYIEKALNGGDWHSSKASKQEKEIIKSIQHELIAIWNKLEELEEDEFKVYLFHKMLLNNIYSLAVLNEVKNILQTFRTDQNVLHISEFNRIISEIVFAEPVPFIYERLGEKYSNYLIDEFQDTSVVQWHNLLPLIENSLAGNFFNMLVGDGKQSIYRFRGGEVEQFAKLPLVIDPSENSLIKEREQSLVRNYKAEHLGTNYRSKSNIVQFNNSFFRSLSGKLRTGTNLIYDQLEQEFVPGKEGGYVRIEELEPEEDDKGEIFVSKTLDLVNQLIAEGWNHSDIAILVRKNKEGSMIAESLLKNGIPVLSSDSLLLRNSAIVNFMVSILRCVDFPTDQLASAQVLEYLVSTKIINQELDVCLSDFSQHQNNLQSVLSANNISIDLLRSSRLPLYQRCEEIITAFGLGKSSDAYLIFFLDEILNYTNSRSKDKTDFFAFWEDRSRNASIVVAAGMNAVNIMTIHKSKGLEFPVVIIPFANWEIANFKNKKWIQFSDPTIPKLKTALVGLSSELSKTHFKEIFEEEQDKLILDSINNLYVAMTRAEQRLYIFTEKDEGKKSKKDDEKESNYISYFFAPCLSAIKMPYLNNISESGIISPPEKQKRKEIVCIQPLTIQSNLWEDRIRIKSTSSDYWDKDDANGSRDKGNLIHNILSTISTAADIDWAIEKAIQDGLMVIADGKQISDLLKKLVQLPELQNSFSGKGKIRMEAEILLPDGNRLRPDRVVETKNETIIIDYKTGAPNARYKKQLDQYGAVLEKMGYSNIQKKIVYTETFTIESWN